MNIHQIQEFSKYNQGFQYFKIHLLRFYLNLKFFLFIRFKVITDQFLEFNVFINNNRL